MENKSYLRGILGALLGGIVASIPWILVYVYANMIYSILAVIIAIGALKGYQLFKGKIDKKLPFIIVIVSLLSITLATFVIIPCFLLIKNEAVLTINNLLFLYSSGEFVSAIIVDYVISVLFTALGISGVVSSVRKQILESSNSEEDIEISLSNGNNKKDREKVKNYFLDRNAINKDNSIKIEDNSINMDTLNLLLAEGIVVSNEDKYYYSVDGEEKFNKKNKKTLIITSSVILIVMGIIMILSFAFGNNDKEISNFKMDYNISDKYVMYDYEEEEDTYYYVPQSDLSGDSGYFMIYYLDGSYNYSDEWKENVKSNMSEYEDFVKLKREDYYKNSNGLDVVFFDIEFQDFDESIYYIFGENQLFMVDVIDLDMLDTLQADVKDVVDSFKEKNKN